MANVLLGSLVAALLIAIFPNFMPVTGNVTYSEVIVEFTPAAGDQQRIGAMLADLRAMGYDLEVVDVLENVMQGAVVMIASDQVERLRDEPFVAGVHTEKFMRAHLEQSLRLIGADQISVRDPEGRALTGEGIRIAVVDTGIDYTHPDLSGEGDRAKVVDGYDFLDHDDQPQDTDGHGTLVAGIIAADGVLKGVAPKAELLAYRIASEDSYVSTIEMVRALERAVDDDADIVNISLGLDYVSEELDKAVENLVKKGIVVVTAVGNSGESDRSIGSPASAHGAISVGASINGGDESVLVSTLRIDGDETRYDTVPMLGSMPAEEPLRGKLVFAGFATEEDIGDMDLTDTIVLAERGGPVTTRDGVEEARLVYFSEKERNVAEKGAAALIVYNNERGMFLGRLTHDNNELGYEPQIPVVSMSREDGLKLKAMIEAGSTQFASHSFLQPAELRLNDIIEAGGPMAELRVFRGTDLVAGFSSRGPVSPFYMKPDLVAPGASINSTMIDDSYMVTSGTSFAAPHVSGAAALLLQKNPALKPEEVASVLATTADQVRDQYGMAYHYDVAGAGRLNIAAALEAEIAAVPHYAVLHLSPASTGASRVIELRSLGDGLGELTTSMEWNDQAYGELASVSTGIEQSAEPSTNGSDSTALLKIDAVLHKFSAGKLEGRIHVTTDDRRISIPLIIYMDEIAVKASNRDGRIWLSVDAPDQWKFAKVRVTNPEDGGSRSVTLTPSNNLSSIPASKLGEHWIEADVILASGDATGSSILYVTDANPNGTVDVIADYTLLYGVPLKQVLIVAAFLGIAAAVAVAWSSRRTKEEVQPPTSVFR